MKEIKDTGKWKDILGLWVARINISTISTLSKVLYRVNAIPIQIPMAFFTEIKK